MVQANKTSRRSLKSRPPPIRAATGCLFLSAIFLAACPPAPSAPLPEHASIHRRTRWDTTDLDYAEKVGQEALDKLGYQKIIRVAVEAGWIDHRLPRSGNSFDQSIGFWAVFTRYAVAAGVTSQVDSPAPGPADVVAVGILVLGLVDAGLLGGHILNSIAESPPITGPTAAPPVPVARPTSAPAPTVIPTAIPTAVATSDPRDDNLSSCEILRNLCIENPYQPEWNRRKFGTKKDCFSCYRICKEKGVWPSEKCPRDWQN